MPASAVPAVTAPDDVPAIQAALLGWYGEHGRRLNFRSRRDAYAVLVSELMAQQTQISRVEPAWAAFLERFPTVQALAAAPTADVLRAWAGMGYNRRALNLQRAARMIVEEFGGRFPDNVEGLQRLPGVGPYTARAVAAIAFGRRVGAVDTNVRRVLGRVAGGWAGLDDGPLQVVADAMVPDGRAGEWTHALMDVGARFCRPRRPLCGECPLAAWCAAALSGERELPTRSDRGASGTVRFTDTSRWLRGRLVAAARDVPDAGPHAWADAATVGWIRVDVPIGSHDAPSVRAAAAALAAEGLLELHPSDASLARLPR